MLTTGVGECVHFGKNRCDSTFLTPEFRATILLLARSVNGYVFHEAVPDILMPSFALFADMVCVPAYLILGRGVGHAHGRVSVLVLVLMLVLVPMLVLVLIVTLFLGLFETSIPSSSFAASRLSEVWQLRQNACLQVFRSKRCLTLDASSATPQQSHFVLKFSVNKRSEVGLHRVSLLSLCDVGIGGELFGFCSRARPQCNHVSGNRGDRDDCTPACSAAPVPRLSSSSHYRRHRCLFFAAFFQSLSPMFALTLLAITPR